ncbi:MAG: spore germination protein [Epulopiscium sp.]|nr:hypothetical protein [Defluviitaleaceae bacterium]MDK2787242.1 spore germination protein [Candidatus Epulonipiscium sp.]
MFLLSLFKLYKNKDLTDIIYHLTGKFFGFVIILMLFLILLEYLVVSIRDYADILSTMFYLRTPLKYLLLMLIVTAFYVSHKGINIIGSLCWLTYPLMQGVVLLLIPLALKDLDFSYLFPLGGPGVKTLLKLGILHTSVVSEVISLSIFFTQVRSYKEFKNASLLGLGLSILLITVFMVIYISSYGYTVLSTLNYPHHHLTRLVGLGRFAKNLESFFLGFWSIAIAIRFSIYFYTLATLGTSLIKVKSPNTLLPYIAVVVYILARLPENYTQYVFSIRKVGLMVLWIFFTFLSPFLWVVAKLKGEFKS